MPQCCFVCIVYGHVSDKNNTIVADVALNATDCIALRLRYSEDQIL